MLANYYPFMTLLQQRDASRKQRRLDAYAETRRQLRTALSELLPDSSIILFGSLTKPGIFNDRSDVDLALAREPVTINSWSLAGELMDRLGRPVDVVILPHCRFREKILREGEMWTT